MSAEPQHRWSVEEYLAFERGSEIKHELSDGQIYAMSGASRKHNRIVWNLVTVLDPQLRAKGCEGFVNEMRVRIPATDGYFYPDLVVACDEPELEDDELDTLLNPTFVVEVLSPSTTDYDRGRKFAAYRSVPTLRLYLLLAQDEIRAELYVRRDDDRWLLSEVVDPDATLELPVIDATLPLARVYDRVPDLLDRAQ